ITSEIEHSSVLKTFKHLEGDGLNISYIKVDENGIVDLKELTVNIKEKTIFVSIMMVNNEIGTIQPISEIAKIIRKYRKTSKKSSLFPNLEFPIFHTDASQSPLFLDLNVKKLGVDMLTIDGQKIYGPKGVGALYIKNGIKIQPLFFGGSQEFGLRPGTENIPLIVGLSKAVEIASNEKKEFSNKILKLRKYFIDRILKEIPDSKLNGSAEYRTPNNINVSFKNTDHEFLVVQLDESGIFCSTKSSCLNNKDSDSYVLNAINKNKVKMGGVRFSLGEETTKEDLDYVIEKLKKFV
ncbi:MAG: cysteine desulfurase family protein, partial [Patescibacteria group bacterium]